MARLESSVSSISEIDLDRPIIEEYLTTESIQESPKRLHLKDLLDISPTLTEAAGAIIDAADLAESVLRRLDEK